VVDHVIDVRRFIHLISSLLFDNLAVVLVSGALLGRDVAVIYPGHHLLGTRVYLLVVQLCGLLNRYSFLPVQAWRHRLSRRCGPTRLAAANAVGTDTPASLVGATIQVLVHGPFR
jgi:hypothetical protein